MIQGPICWSNWTAVGKYHKYSVQVSEAVYPYICWCRFKTSLILRNYSSFHNETIIIIYSWFRLLLRTCWSSPVKHKNHSELWICWSEKKITDIRSRKNYSDSKVKVKRKSDLEWNSGTKQEIVLTYVNMLSLTLGNILRHACQTVASGTCFRVARRYQSFPFNVCIKTEYIKMPPLFTEIVIYQIQRSAKQHEGRDHSSNSLWLKV